MPKQRITITEKHSVRGDDYYTLRWDDNTGEGVFLKVPEALRKRVKVVRVPGSHPATCA